MKTKSKRIGNWLSVIFFTIGLVLLVSLVKKVGWPEVSSTIQRLGWGIVYVFIFPLTWTCIQSFAWWRVLADDDVKVSFWHVMLAKITGEAINTITPVSFIGGDPYRIYLLQKKVAGTKSAASVVIDRTMYMLAVVLLLFVTLVVAWFSLPLPGAWRVLFPVFTFLFFAVFVAVVRLQQKGMFGVVSRLLQRLHVGRERLKAIEEKITNLDHHIGAFYRKHKAHFFEIMILQFIGRFLGAVEVYMIVKLLDLPVLFIHCLFLTSLTILINIAFVFIPGSLGVMESGYGALFHLINLNPAYGVAIQLIRRIRTFFWIGLGLLIMLVYRPSADKKKEGAFS